MVKVKAFSLFDSLIAVTIVAILIGAVSFAYGKLIESEKPILFYKAKEEITKLHHEMVQSKAYINKTVQLEPYTIDQEIDNYQGRNDLWLVKYTVLLSSKTLYTTKRIVVNEEEQ